MAIQWGGQHGKMQLGIDVRHDGVGAGTPWINVYVDIWVRVVSWRYDDNQRIDLGGSIGGAINFKNYQASTGTTQFHVYTHTINTQWLSYGGGPTYTFAAYLSGAYDGSAPSCGITWTLPGKVPLAPDAPGGLSFSNITPSNIRVHCPVPGNNGSGIVEWQFRRADNFNFNSNVADYFHLGNVLDIPNLDRARAYAFAVRCRNGVGWSGWSTYAMASTAATVPDAPALPTASAIGPVSANVNWTQPNDGGQAMSTFNIQRATDAAFTKDVSTQDDPTSPTTLLALTPGTKYYVRIRGVSPVGNGVWSPTLTFDTLSGAKIHTGSGWVDHVARVHDGTGWKISIVKKRPSDTWVN